MHMKLGQFTRLSGAIKEAMSARLDTPSRAALLVGVGLLAQPLLATYASAAEPEVQEAVAATSNTADQQVDRVVVTARKSSELAQDVPMAVSAIRADAMVQQNLLSVRDYFSQVPGLSLSARANGRNDIALRGIITGADSNPTTAVTIDDTPFGASTSRGLGGSMMPDLDPFDLQRIEVLRGPQGSLYGATSLGGLIKYVTVVPNTSKFSARVQVDGSATAHGDNGNGQRAALNIPLIADKLAMRVSAFHRRDPAYIDDVLQQKEDVNDSSSTGGRVSLIWHASDDITVRSSALTQKSSAGASNGVDYNYLGTPIHGQYVHSRSPGTDGYDRKIGFYDVAVEADLKWAKLTSVTAMGRNDFHTDQDVTQIFTGLMRGLYGITGSGALMDAPTSTKKFTQEFRLESPDDNRALEWRVGVFYTKEDTLGEQTLSAIDAVTGAPRNLPLAYYTGTDSTFKEVAGFGSVTYHFTDKFDLQAGGRYSRNSQDFSSFSDGLYVGGPRTEIGESSENAVTYMITPRYRFSPDLMVYATLSTGYRPGGPNTASVFNLPKSYESDSTRNFELGLKQQLFDRTVSLAASIYSIKWKDVQFAQTDPATRFGYTGNAGGAKSEGIELQGEWLPWRGLLVSGNAVVSRAELTTATPDSVYGLVGDSLPFSAKRTASLSANQRFDTFAGLKAFVGGSVAYVGERPMAFAPNATSPRYFAPAYTTINLQAGVGKDNWRLNLFAKNLADKVGIQSITSRSSQSVVTSDRLYQITAPRTIGASLAFDF